MAINIKSKICLIRKNVSREGEQVVLNGARGDGALSTRGNLCKYAGGERSGLRGQHL